MKSGRSRWIQQAALLAVVYVVLGGGVASALDRWVGVQVDNTIDGVVNPSPLAIDGALTYMEDIGDPPVATEINEYSFLDLSQAGLVTPAATFLYAGNGGAEALAAAVLDGRAGGSWGGYGIRSTEVASHSTWGLGYLDNGFKGPGTRVRDTFRGIDLTAGDFAGVNQFLVGPTLVGDADLSGTVNFDDILQMFDFYGKASDAKWYEGDWNYSGAVNFDDVLVMFDNYGNSWSYVAPTGMGVAGMSAEDSVTAVPEPGTLGLCGLGAIVLGSFMVVRRKRMAKEGGVVVSSRHGLKYTTLLLVFGMVVLAMTQPVSATLMFDLRPVGTDPVAGDRTVVISDPTAEVVELGIYAYVSYNGTAPAYQSGFTSASLVFNKTFDTTGGVKPFKAYMIADKSSAIDFFGTPVESDLNGDGDVDRLGDGTTGNSAGFQVLNEKNGTAGGTNQKLWYAKTSGSYTATSRTIGGQKYWEFQIGTLTLDPTSYDMSAPGYYTTTVNLSLATSGASDAFKWLQNGVWTGPNGNDPISNVGSAASVGDGGNYLIGSGTTIVWEVADLGNDSILAVDPAQIVSANMLAGPVPYAINKTGNSATTADVGGLDTAAGIAFGEGAQSVGRYLNLPYGNTVGEVTVSNLGNTGNTVAPINVNVTGAGLATLGTALTSPISAGKTLAGLKSKVVSGAGALMSEAVIVAGTAPEGATQISMTWRARTAAEKTAGSSVLPSGIAFLASDVVDVTGTGTDNPYVLQMSYDPSLFGSDAAELSAFNGGALYLAYLNSGKWENAADKVGDTWAAGYGRAYSSELDGLTIGHWGVDTANNVAWAVVTHNSEFAVVPEPGTIALLGVALAGLAMAWFRRKRA